METQKVYKYNKSYDETYIQYLFWKGNEGWSVIKTVYSPNLDMKTTEIFIPFEIISTMLNETTKEELVKINEDIEEKS